MDGHLAFMFSLQIDLCFLLNGWPWLPMTLTLYCSYQNCVYNIQLSPITIFMYKTLAFIKEAIGWVDYELLKF
jgi:hypothetical protein